MALARRAPGLAARIARQSERLAHALTIYIQRAGSNGQINDTQHFCVEVAKLGEHLTPVEMMKLLDDHGLLTNTMFQRILHEMFALRQNKRLLEIINDESFGRDDLRLYHKARMAHYLGKDAPDVDSLMKLLHTKASLVSPKQAIGLIMEQVIRQEDADGLERLLREEAPLIEALARDSSILGSLRLLLKKNRLQSARDLLTRHLGSIAPRRRYYFLEIAHILFPDGMPQFGIAKHPGWRQVLDEFAKYGGTATNPGWQMLSAKLLEPLKLIPPGEADYMDIRIDSAQADRLSAHVLDCVKNGTPCSLVRLGDGEAYAFSSADLGFGTPKQFQDDNAVRERHWWGMTLDESRRQVIAAAVCRAAARADIIGTPSVYRIIRDAGTDDFKFGASMAHRGLAVVLNAFGKEVPVEGKIFTEERCNQLLFSEPRVKALIQAAKQTIIVSCWSREQLQHSLDCDFQSILIAPHTKVSHTCQTDQTALPLSYETILAQVQAASAPGHLVLVGAGLIGKIFVDEARKRGAVALDVGAILDYFAGFKTRNIADLV